MVNRTYLRFIIKLDSAQMYTMKRCVEVNLRA